MSAGIQLNFNLRTSSKCKTVHLVGSWDSYKSNLPLNKDSSKSGGWKGTFRFSSPMMVPGQRYWYYYIIDGYHVSHDPNHNHVTEPTTGRQLNVLDIPSSGGSHPTMQPSAAPSRSHRHSMANGRSLSPSQIQHPHPSRPYETQNFRSSKFSAAEMEALSRRYAAQRLAESSDSSDDSDSDSDDSLPSLPSLSSRSSNNSSPSSVSSMSSGSPVMGSTAAFMGGMRGGSGCSCERYAVTKAGMRVKLDCGGKVCGSDGSGSSSSDSESEEDRRRRKHRSSTKKSSSSGKSKRHGLKIKR